DSKQDRIVQTEALYRALEGCRRAVRSRSPGRSNMTSHVSVRFTFPAFPFCARHLVVLALLVPLASCASGRATAPPPTGVGLIGEELRPVPSTLLGNVEYDLPVEANTWVQSELDFLLGDRRETVRSWLQRSDFYADF